MRPRYPLGSRMGLPRLAGMTLRAPITSRTKRCFSSQSKPASLISTPSLATLAPLATRGGSSGISEQGPRPARWAKMALLLTSTWREYLSQARLRTRCPISLRRRTKY
jgi:hypothetical protein